MKRLILLSMTTALAFCSRVTTKPDRLSTTSGTMGSVKATDRPARLPIDTTRAVDTATFKKDSIR